MKNVKHGDAGTRREGRPRFCVSAIRNFFWVVILGTLAACGGNASRTPADLLLLHGRVYTLSWDEPAPDGTPALNAPHSSSGWRPDAEAVAVREGKIIFVGSGRGVEAYRGGHTRVIDVQGGTVIPGLVDSHVHIAELGAALDRVNLTGVETEAEAVDKVVERAATVPKGEWIVGWGWDEGAWANRYPDMKLLSEKVPEHPAYLKGLHGFAVWGNRMAFNRAGITAATKAPAGGEIQKDKSGKPTGILLNNARKLLEDAIPPLTPEKLKDHIVAGLSALAAAGYVAVHEAGAGSAIMEAFKNLDAEGKLQLRVHAMLSGRDEALIRAWLAKGPDAGKEGMLITRTVKAHYDGALGSRGARLLEEYSDRKGHRGVSGENYGFNKELIAEMMKKGFQAAIHAIGDAGNRETLDFIQSVEASDPKTVALRNRIEHAQVLHPDDVPRFAKLNVIASMEPPHAVEDKAWAEDRLGPERVKGAYAWRTLRKSGAHLVFNSDLPGSDYNIFYGLHSAITRRGRDLQPKDGWYADERMTPEEAIRGYTAWAAYAAFLENETGILAPGRWADITVMDIDPFVLGTTEPEKILGGSIRLAVAGGKVVYQKK